MHGERMKDALRGMIANRQKGIHAGIASYCSANELVIEAVLEQAKRFNDVVLIEATANQVNQFGGYTGMTPEAFKTFVHGIAESIDFPVENIVLGGDHLGPLIWADLTEADAMDKSVDLVKDYVRAGYKKIHLDTSMRLGDDPQDTPLAVDVIARRGGILYEACQEAYHELLTVNPEELQPVYIIGSEVPIPGGAQGEEEHIEVTKPDDVVETISIYQHTFQGLGVDDALENIIGVVVQPGVEFGDSEIHHYNRKEAADLCELMRSYENIVLEGHSTDYQSPRQLKEMVEDGIAILKVGPALTYALREGLFALSMIEKELVPFEDRADFIEALDEKMLKEPGNWKKHYFGNEANLKIKRKFSFSDRCRYYFADEDVVSSMNELFDNLDTIDIPLNVLRQYMPVQYVKVRDGKLKFDSRSLVKDCVVETVEAYNYATKHNYMINEIS